DPHERVPRTAPVRCLATSPDGKFLAVGTADAIELRKLDAKPDALEVVCTFRAAPRASLQPPPPGGPTELAFSADGLSLASAGPEQVVRVWDCSPGRPSENFTPKRIFRGHDRAVTGVCFNRGTRESGAGERLFSASADHSV